MSELFIQLTEKGILQKGIWETVYLTFISAFFFIHYRTSARSHFKHNR